MPAKAAERPPRPVMQVEGKEILLVAHVAEPAEKCGDIAPVPIVIGAVMMQLQVVRYTPDTSQSVVDWRRSEPAGGIFRIDQAYSLAAFGIDEIRSQRKLHGASSRKRVPQSPRLHVIDENRVPVSTDPSVRVVIAPATTRRERGPEAPVIGVVDQPLGIQRPGPRPGSPGVVDHVLSLFRSGNMYWVNSTQRF